MSVWLGKSNFSQGLTTKKRGVYGNIPVLNICHGYDISSGELVPVRNVSAIDLTHTLSYNEGAGYYDYVIEKNGEYYSYTDFLNEYWTDNTTVSDYFGSPVLLSKPCISDELIVYPTDKGLFSYEPECHKVRFVSFMAPDDYDKHPDKDIDTDYHIQVSYDTDHKVQLFTATNVYTTHNAILEYEIFDGGNTNDILKISLQPNISRADGFYVSKAIDLDGISKGWFVYDMRIEGDTQTYMSSTIFENGDATLSGYEFVFYNPNDDEIEPVRVGITKLEPLADKWFRCISYVEFDTPSNYTHIKLTNANYYENKHDTKIYIGCQSFKPEDWKHVGNYLFAGEKGRGSYAEQFKRSIDHTEDIQTAQNVIDDYDFSDANVISDTLWVETPDYPIDYKSGIATSSVIPTPPYGTNLSLSKYAWTRDNSSTFYYATVEPNCNYEFGCMTYLKKEDEEKPMVVKLSLIQRDGSQKPLYSSEGNRVYHSDDDNWYEIYTNPTNGTKTELFTGNSNQIVIEMRNNGNKERKGFTGVWLKKISQLPFYKTTRVLYDYSKEDMLDEDYQVHNCCEFSYSFCGRNKLKTKQAHEGTVKDQFKLMISNASKETDKFADHPFASHIVSLTKFPTVEINNVERDVKTVYGDYWTDILLYKSIIYGQTEIQEDFSYIGRINKETTTGDHRMTSTGFYFKDNDSEREDKEREDYYDIDEWHAVNPEQEIYNDFLRQAQCCVHLNGRLFCGNLDDKAQKTALAVSNYDENWIFPTSVDEGSITGTGTQTDNLHNVSNELNALASCKDRLFLFYDKEVIYMYGNDFYSNNGFGHTQVARLSIIPKTIQNGIRDLYGSDGNEFYHFGVQGEIHCISYRRVETKTMNFDNASTMYWDNKYYIRCKQLSKGVPVNIIYVYDVNNNGWYTIDNQNIVQLIDNIMNPEVLAKEDDTYGIANMFGGDLSGRRIIETMYQIVNAGETGSNPQFDVDINDFATELETEADNETINLKFFGQGEFIETWEKPMLIDSRHIRYNKKVRFNKSVSAVKQRLEYTGDFPPTIYSIGVIRNDAKARE